MAAALAPPRPRGDRRAGWYPLSSSGSRAFPQDPDFQSLGYSWKANHVPLQLGLEDRLPLALQGVSFFADATFAAIFSSYTATYTAENVTDATQDGWALGLGLGVGAAYPLGPGAITAQVRWLNARTDLRLQSLYPGQPHNAQQGDVQGTNVLVGYRIAL